jgi:hypothetical protein
MLFLLWFSTTVCEGRLYERLKIYSGKYLFNKSKFYLEQFLTLSDGDEYVPHCFKVIGYYVLR